ncbi:hypothetical protein L226DRAFT_567304 [Lentinus tigrinus ALCF2SS1-7]|uniref:Uncharacterized protein n=1 Tax=Lentinus tigrinus ALCF2SS1-6 TaxID=1328759 RepID=A0A5C2SWH7_9APHY|nr:hypothetical protein L227DRAFT_212872 [Lentinus tigrinus ALCF2SS1-6]RPD79121.1 hypothetical protein L226DRAFT_567304 [Lentinus tigrinus ALCF2SS1-7]
MLYSKCNQVSIESRRLADELSKVKRHSSPRADESGYSYPYDRKAEPITTPRDYAADRETVKDKVNFFLLSPVPHSQPVPDLPSNMSHFNPLADDDESSDEAFEKIKPHAISSASRAIPIMHRSDSYRDRARSNASLLSRPDPDAMSISVPKSNLDVHMSGSSVSPNGPAFQYGSRPKDFVPSSLERLPENALGLRADIARPPLTDVDPELRVRQLAQLHEVLRDPAPTTSPRKPSVSDGSERERDRARAAVPSAMSSTRTPSPVSSASHSYSSSHMEKEHNSAPYKSNPTAISCASHAAAARERARASSVNSQNAPSAPPPPSSVTPTASVASTTSLSHITAMRDQPLHALYPQTQPQSAPRPAQPRRQSSDNYALSSSLSKGRIAALGVVPPPRYPSNLTRAMQGIPS